MFEEALAQAEELDEYLHVHGKPKGMLHGLPISVKEHVFVQGTTATSGLIAWADQMSPCDALIVQTFREQGAVFHVKTTNPQTLMAIETDSNLFGRTLNPHNPNLTCGGSTGGEGALIAMGGSVLGIGTDIGGSIRVPSAFCGLFGLKPSVGRLPHSGLCGLHDGMQNIIGAVGPLARCREDIELFCSAALANRPWDHEPSMMEIPWKKEVQTPSKLKFAVIWTDGVIQPHPPVTNALQEVVSSLKSSGHTVVDWDTGLHEALTNTVNEAYFLDGGKEYWAALDAGGEPPVPMLEWILNVPGKRSYTVEETWKVWPFSPFPGCDFANIVMKLNSELDLLRTMYARQWNAAGIDAVICPTSPTVASVHGESRYWGYTSVWNALDYSAAAIPCRKVLPSDTLDNSAPRPVSQNMAANDWFQELYAPQGPERYVNAPVGVQVVCRRFQEERLLQIVAKIEASLSSAAVAKGTDSADEAVVTQQVPHKDGGLYKISTTEDKVAAVAA